jgi:hypothetical protein
MADTCRQEQQTSGNNKRIFIVPAGLLLYASRFIETGYLYSKRQGRNPPVSVAGQQSLEECSNIVHRVQ